MLPHGPEAVFPMVLGVAAVTAGMLVSAPARRDGVRGGRLVSVLAMLAASALAGAKLYSVVERGERAWWTFEWWTRGELLEGYRHPGGMLGLAVGMALVPFVFRRRPSALRLADWLAPATCIALALVRVNCFLRKCCSGTVCHAVWCHLDGGPGRHPLAIYFGLWALAVAVVLAWAEPRKRYDGQVALLYLAIHEGGKAAIELFRFPPTPTVQAGSLAISIVATTVLLAIGLLRPAPRAAAAPARTGRLVAGAGVLLMMAVAAGPAFADASAPADRRAGALVVAQDRISGHLDDGPLDAAIADVARAFGATVTGSSGRGATVHAALHDETLDDVLRQLLGAGSFNVVYGVDGRPRRIVVYGDPASAGAAPVAPPRPPVATPSAALPPPPPGLLARPMPVPSSGALHDLTGRGTLTLGEVMQLALTHDDEAVRRDALSAGVRAVEADASGLAWLRTTMQAVAGNAADGSGAAPDARMRQALETVAASARDADVRAAAARALEAHPGAQ